MDRSWQRPTIKIPKSRSEWVWDVIGYSIFIGSILFLVAVWQRLPNQVPAHYNAMGEVDRWGSKWELIIVPMIGLFLLVMMQFLEKHPEWHNYPARFNESNAKAFYLLSRKLLNMEKNICLVALAALQVETVTVALQWSDGLGLWYLPLVIIFVLLPIVIMIVKQRKIT